jgi:NitT/TauT family transport system substrate-binding protein
VEGRGTKPCSRRAFLGGLALTGTAGLVDVALEPASADPPPETTKLRLTRNAMCFAPQYVAKELLHLEGFTDVQYIKTEPADIPKSLTRTTDMTMHTPGPLIIAVDTREPIVMLGGIHVGCFELFGTDRIRSIDDLKGKSVAGGRWDPAGRSSLP